MEKKWGKRRAQKHKSWWKQVDFTKEIWAYGFHYSTKSYLKSLLLVCAGTLVIGWAFSLQLRYIALLTLVIVLLLPKLILCQFQYLYEAQRFEDAILYMEQMIYSMEKTPKIREAMADTSSIAEGPLRELLIEVLERIDAAKDVSMYEVAFSKIEEQYGCEKMMSLHKFFIQVETQGGEYKTYLRILHDDLKNWIVSVYEFQKDIKKIKRNVLLSTAVSLASSALMTRLIPEDYTYTGMMFYQIFITIVLSFSFYFYRLIQIKLNMKWLSIPVKLKKQEAERLYQKAVFGNVQEERKKLLVPLLVLVVLGLLIDFLWHWIWGSIGLWGLAVLLWWLPGYRLRSYKKRAERELVKAYPDWVRAIALRLQIETVQSAIFSSYAEADEMIKPEIRKLLVNFEEHPNTVEPYNHFLEAFHLIEQKSSFRMFYAIQNLGKEESKAQISALMERNMKLADKAERIHHEDQVASAMLLTNVPSMFGMVIILVSIVLLLTSFTKIMNNTTKELDLNNIWGEEVSAEARSE